MEDFQEKLKYLLTRYKDQVATPSEENELFALINDALQEENIKTIMFQMMQAEQWTAEFDKDHWEPVFRKVLSEKENDDSAASPVYKMPADRPIQRSARKVYLKRLAIAASVLIVLSPGLYFLFSTGNRFSSPVAKVQGGGKTVTDIIPDKNQAVLTLADGSVINLDSADNGTLINQGAVRIIKKEDGELIYFVDQRNTATAGYNTISTPRGGKYEIVLSDGSKVWLDAASSLRFPTSFNGKTRNVSLNGEGYFEVAKNASMPFSVTVNDMTVKVLGTHFNVNAYDDENSVETTLLEGSVEVKMRSSAAAHSQPVILKPGERAAITRNGSLEIDHHANIGETIAWKDGNFEFSNTLIPALMRQISRRYNVEVDYIGSVPDRRFTGKFSAKTTLSQLIDMLQYGGVNMRIENSRILISEE